MAKNGYGKTVGGHSGTPQHDHYARTGEVEQIPGGNAKAEGRRQFAKGGFVSTNDEAHKRCGAPLHYEKTVKVKTRQP